MTAMRDPSGDQLGKPNAPPAASARGLDDPSVSTIESELSAARRAIEPVDAIGWSIGSEVAGDGLAGGLDVAPLAAALAGGRVLVDAASDGEGLGLPQPATRTARTTLEAMPRWDLIA
jgi:hypothetical protein